MSMNDIAFTCDGKCRICPYPGANCKEIRIKPEIGEREEDVHRIWMSPEFQSELVKGMLVLKKRD